MVCPHEEFALIVRDDSWEDVLFGGDVAIAARYWHAMRDQPWLLQHNHRELAASRPTETVPIKIHGDDAKGFMITSWSSLCSRKFDRFFTSTMDIEKFNVCDPTGLAGEIVQSVLN